MVGNNRKKKIFNKGIEELKFSFRHINNENQIHAVKKTFVNFRFCKILCISVKIVWKSAQTSQDNGLGQAPN